MSSWFEVKSRNNPHTEPLIQRLETKRRYLLLLQCQSLYLPKRCVEQRNLNKYIKNILQSLDNLVFCSKPVQIKPLDLGYLLKLHQSC